ncbi:GNAT family N-acetyltransferase [Humitalea sp. 24SJ18S-53]|uniref:GNAT family N-acetyltransferase n=1 Tax=Humitalea sp. 24SJ18S-53 TaxID=3422307 RepID=UPI003D676E47
MIVVETPGGPAEAEILAGLIAHNAEATGSGQRHPLLLALRDDAGALIGGLKAEVVHGWLFVDNLWIAAAGRGRGQGAALMARAEAAGRALGAVGGHLYTSTFQAPGFYEKLGYREIGRLQGRPAGHDRIWMAKRWG